MRTFLARLWFTAALLCPAFPSLAQEAAVTVPPAGDFFSGSVLSCTANEVTVNRKGLGKETAATKTFLIDSRTKVEGSLKPKAQVTVRFVAEDGGARAVHIIVR